MAVLPKISLLNLKKSFLFILLLCHLVIAVILIFLFCTPPFSYLFSSSLFKHSYVWWGKRLCTILGIQISYQGKIPTENTFIVANHTSWLDICAFLTTSPAIFIAPQKIRNWLVIGWLGQKLDTVFIRCEHKKLIKRATKKIHQHLKQKRNIIYFPEIFYSCNREVNPFQSHFFQAAKKQNVSIQPVAIDYNQSTYEFNQVHRKKSLFANIWALFEAKNIAINLIFAPPLPTHKQKRQVLAKMAQQSITQLLD